MTTETTTAAAVESKAKTVLDDMASRRFFDSPDEAAAYIEQCQADYADFDSLPIAFAGATADGDFDPEIYNESMRVCVAVLTQRGEGVGAKSSVKAIVIYPAPKLEAILATNGGQAWLDAIVDKELNHVAVRQLRKADTPDGLKMADAVAQMPTTVAAFITSSRESAGGILETYNALWQVIKKALSAKSKAFALAPLSKKELRKAMESASYAAAVYPTLELRKDKAGNPQSLFEVAATFGVKLAKGESLDPAFFERALANRNETQIDLADDEDDFDLDAMAAEALKPEDGESQPTEATETPDGDGDQ